MSEHRRQAAQAVARMFKLCEPVDTSDPEAFLSAAIGILTEYPVAVMEVIADPVRGLPSRVRRPGLVDIRKACEVAYEPIERQLERERAGVLMLPAPPAAPKLTRAEIEKRLGHPIGEPRRSVVPTDTEHGQRVLADLAARKAAREQEGGELPPAA